jgi:hypothetical protein
MPADMTHAASNIWIWIFMLIVPAIALVFSVLLARRSKVRHEDEDEDRQINEMTRRAPPPHLDSPEKPREEDGRRSA